MLTGDEVGALVLDIGAHTTKAGFAGEDTPKAVFSTRIGVLAAESASSTTTTSTTATGAGKRKVVIGDGLSVPKGGMEIVQPFDEAGVVKDWEAYERVFEHALLTAIDINPTEHPLLCSEPVMVSRQQREKVCEIAFETHKVPAFFVAKTPVLTAFASGKSTALIIDCGATATTVTPVLEGYALRKSAMVSRISGDFLTSEVLKSVKVPIRPRYMFRRKVSKEGEFQVTDVPGPEGITESYKNLCIREIADDIKKSVLHVPSSSPPAATAEQMQVDSSSSSSYQLPDGTVVEFVGTHRDRMADLLFSGGGNSESMSVQQMVAESLGKCDVDIRQTLWNSAVVTGGGSLLPGFTERLVTELHQASHSFKGKIIAPNNTEERTYAAWIGGSILASLGTFHQLWISQQEYEEFGKSIIDKKCP